MSVKIRLSRTGKKNQPSYRIIIIDESKKRNGMYLEKIGNYNPNLTPHFVKIDRKRYDYWLSVGAKPTKTVKNLVEKIK